MHILEDHVIPWLQRWKIGAGLMGKQGAESIHAHIARLEQQYSSIANPLERIKYVYREHNLESAPELNNRTSLRMTTYKIMYQYFRPSYLTVIKR